MIDILISLCIFLIAGISAGCLTALFLFSAGGPDVKDFRPSRIFSFYGLWLQERYNAHEQKVDEAIAIMERAVLEGPGTIDERMEIVTRKSNLIRAKKLNLYKALGMCGYCTATWASAIVGFLFVVVFGMTPWLVILTPGVGTLTYALVRPRFP